MKMYLNGGTGEGLNAFCEELTSAQARELASMLVENAEVLDALTNCRVRKLSPNE